jgi:hypothetical protein
MLTSECILKFYDELVCPQLPNGIEPLLPFNNEETKLTMKIFYNKYYCDEKQRTVLFGINPGRFGAGLTGINFTDPIRLAENCGIPNNFNPRPELSSVFIYEMIKHWSGEKNFYEKFWFSAISPIGFVENGRNINYYDKPELQNTTKDFIVKCLKQQCEMNINRKVTFIVGQGKNLEFFRKVNEAYGFFEKIEALPHPRWIMQYRLKDKQFYIDEYLKKLALGIAK